MDKLTGMLPGGYFDASGRLHREFELGVLTGRDEEMLAESRRARPASLVSSVLSRAVRRIGDISPVTEQIARELLVADRQYLLLRLRQATFGNLVRADLFCPWADCGSRMQIQFCIDQVPVEEASERAPVYSMTLSQDALDESEKAQRKVRFRLPNGEDQEAVSPLLAHNEAEALSMLLARAVQAGPEVIDQLSPRARMEIEAEMERVAPKIEPSIETACQECGRSFAAPFDVQRFFFGEMRTDGDLLYRQVHYLAYHYHWSENEIMAMPRTKRHQYVDLLAEEMERLNDGA
jgi:hypothetical protein